MEIEAGAAARGWERALCVVAHPTTSEFGAAAAVARWTSQGKRVAYCMLTSGEAGIDGMHPDGAGASARPSRSSRRGSWACPRSSSCTSPTGSSEYGVPLRREIAQVVRRHRPEIVVTGNFRETWGGASLNQADHIATGRAVVDALRDAGNRWVFPSSSTGARAVGGVRAVWAFGSPSRDARGRRPTRSTPAWPPSRRTGPTIDGLGWEHFDAREFLGASDGGGQRLSVPFAATFEVFPMGWGE